MLDEFVWGKVGRISPEAPVPVVEVTGESFYPGGAANVARNLREFVDDVAVIGLIGSDRGGRQLRELLAGQKINTADVLEDAEFSTIVKTRIIARTSADRSRGPGTDSPPLPRRRSPQIIASVRGRLAETDAIIFEDYGKGFLSAELVRQICDDAIEGREDRYGGSESASSDRMEEHDGGKTKSERSVSRRRRAVERSG